MWTDYIQNQQMTEENSEDKQPSYKSNVHYHAKEMRTQKSKDAVQQLVRRSHLKKTNTKRIVENKFKICLP